MKKLRGLQTYKSIAFSYEQIPLTHFYHLPFSFLLFEHTAVGEFFGKIYDFLYIPCR